MILRKVIDLQDRRFYGIYVGDGHLGRPILAMNVASTSDRKATAAALWAARKELRRALADGAPANPPKVRTPKPSRRVR